MRAEYATGSLERVTDRMDLGLLLVGGDRTVIRINPAGERIRGAGGEVVGRDLVETLPEARLFLTEVTTKTGLAPALVQEIVEAHGGTISVCGLPAGGTRVEIL